jgi:hypothetical protein
MQLLSCHSFMLATFSQSNRRSGFGPLHALNTDIHKIKADSGGCHYADEPIYVGPALALMAC